MTPSQPLQIRNAIAAVLADAAQLGITLQARIDSGGSKLRFHPRSATMPVLAKRIMANRLALLADTTPPGELATGLHDGEMGVSHCGSSVLSVSGQEQDAIEEMGMSTSLKEKFML